MFKTSLDGKNLEIVLAEFGYELYGVLYEHIQHFAVSDTGMLEHVLKACTVITMEVLLHMQGVRVYIGWYA